MTKCSYCSNSLYIIGLDRKNGKRIMNSDGKDWPDRKYHIKCYGILKKKQEDAIFMDNYEMGDNVIAFKKRYNLDKLLK